MAYIRTSQFVRVHGLQIKADAANMKLDMVDSFALQPLTSNSCKTLIGVHEMHGRMHPN